MIFGSNGWLIRKTRIAIFFSETNLWYRRAKARRNRHKDLKQKIDRSEGAMTVLFHAMARMDLLPLVFLTTDPSFRSNLTSHTLKHVAIQTMALLCYFEVLLELLEKELQICFSPAGTKLSLNSEEIATKEGALVGRVCARTLRGWRDDFFENGCRFSESKKGKAVSSWILDNKIMADAAREWLKSNVGRKPKEGEAHFTIEKFQKYLNDDLLVTWEIPKWKGSRSATKCGVDLASNFCRCPTMVLFRGPNCSVSSIQ